MHRTHLEHRTPSPYSTAHGPAPRRVALLPLTPDHLLALVDAPAVDAPARFAARFGYPLADGIADMYAGGDVSPAWRARLQAATAADPWEHGFAVLHGDDARVIGTAGFKGPPDADGVVEIAYGVAPAYQGQGYATEAARALLAFAFADGRVRRVRAHTQPHDGPSPGVLRRCGFALVATVDDPEDGPVWRWERGHATTTTPDRTTPDGTTPDGTTPDGTTPEGTAPAAAGAAPERPVGRRPAGTRWFHAGMGVVAILVAVVGFSGPMPGDVPGPRAFSPVVRLHGAVFGGWLALFVAQAALVATGRAAVHRRLGLAAAVLAPLMLVVGVHTAITAARRGYPFDGNPLGMLVHPLGDLVSFAVLVGAGLWYRRRPDVHKRLLLLATVAVLMNAPLTHLHARLPAPLNANPLFFLAPMALLLAASGVHDRVTRGRVHPASLWGAVLLFVWANVRELVIGPSAAWHRVAAWLVG